MNLPTVLETWRLALPPGTTLANTDGALDRELSWARRMASHAPAFAGLEPGDMALVPIDDLRFVDDRLSVPKLVASLGARGAAAIAVDGDVGPAALEAADRSGICVLQVPDATDLRVTEKDILRLILDREAQLDRWGRELYRQMAQHAIGNEGVPAIAVTLAKAVRKSVAILNADFAVLAAVYGDDPAPRSAVDLRWLAQSDLVRRWLMRRDLDGRAPPGALIAQDEQTAPIFLSAVVGDGQVSGFVAVFDEQAAPDGLDGLAAERAALVCAVEMAKQRAVSAAEERLRGDFLDMLLTAGVSESAAVARRAAEMGYSLGGSHIALLLHPGDRSPRVGDIAGHQIRSRFAAAGLDFLVCTHGPLLAVLCRADTPTSPEALEALAAAVLDRITGTLPDATVTIGIGGRGDGLVGLRQSFRQAQETLSLAQELFEGGGLLTYGELPLYDLLGRLQGCRELETFHQRTLAALETYDHDHDAELIRSLEAYFRHFGNVTQTAGSMHLHRNSLIYRLERICDITGLSLDDEEDRFALQLALKLRPFAKAR